MTITTALKSEMDEIKLRLSAIETQMQSLHDEQKMLHEKLDTMMKSSQTKKSTHLDVMLSSSFSTEYIAINTKMDELKEHARTVGIKGISGKRKRT